MAETEGTLPERARASLDHALGAHSDQDSRISVVMDGMASAFALTHGPSHTLTYANAAFRTLVGDAFLGALGGPIGTDLMTREGVPLAILLDRAFRMGMPVRNQALQHLDILSLAVVCSVWPSCSRSGDAERLLIEMRPSTSEETTLALQREVAERLLLKVLREQDAAAHAETARRSADFLLDESLRLGQSLDEGETIEAITRTRLPYVGSWCVVDLLAPDHTMRRLTVIHPDPETQVMLDALDGRWTPHVDDEYGLPVVVRVDGTAPVEVNLAVLLEAMSDPPEIHATLQALGAGPSLIVPLRVGSRLIGAIMFVAARAGHEYTLEDIRLASELGDRSAAALDRARLYSESMALRIRAEAASEAKSTFLGMMSHELRTPLNAIAGYVDLIDMEVRGPVTPEQRKDLGRIRTNHKYLTGLINDLLSLTKLNGGQTVYNTVDVEAQEIIAASRSLVAPLMAERELIFEDLTDGQPCIARGDREKVMQIMVNLFSNAIKFTPPRGTIQVSCTVSDRTLAIRVRDSGIGIAAEKLELIFDPFMQIDGSSLSAEAGVGLGLAISRGLARAMHGDLVAESVFGQGARFTLTLPCAPSVPDAGDAR